MKLIIPYLLSLALHSFYIKKAWESQINPSYLKEQTFKMRKMVDRTAEIISNLRYFSQSHEGGLRYEKVSLADLIHRVTSLCLQKFKNSHVEFKIMLPEKTVELFCDSLSLCQALFQLLSNAYDAVMDIKEKRVDLQVELIGDDIHFIVRGFW